MHVFAQPLKLRVDFAGSIKASTVCCGVALTLCKQFVDFLSKNFELFEQFRIFGFYDNIIAENQQKMKLLTKPIEIYYF